MPLARLGLCHLLLATLAAGTAAAQSQAPDEGQQEEQAPASDFPRCFGAASRDPLEPCRNKRLARMVCPYPLDALLVSNSDCKS